VASRKAPKVFIAPKYILIFPESKANILVLVQDARALVGSIPTSGLSIFNLKLGDNMYKKKTDWSFTRFVNGRKQYEQENTNPRKGVIVWPSSIKGTYVRSKHGPLKS